MTFPPPYATPREILDDLRRGLLLPSAAFAAFVRGLADGTVSDAQAGAFAMGICRGPALGTARCAALTRAMADSGERLSWGPGAPILDKHSTGGLGDAVSLVLAPAVAALGARVPMVSGRGLGHTGGTLDKLDAIPGFVTELPEARFRAVVAGTGCAIAAASDRLAPADRRLYAIRDATGTVDQVNLIASSILSKKLAAGVGTLILDVKAGSGAFMPDAASAQRLARLLVAIAREAGLPATALVTAMDQPLAPACGNALEVAEAITTLRGEAHDTRLRTVTLALGAELLAAGGLATDPEAGRCRMEEVLDTGRAAERFAAMVAGQGGPADLLDAPHRHLPAAPVIRDVPAMAGGVLEAVDGRALGCAIVALGGGRAREGEAIDPAVGLDRVARIGTPLAPGDPLCRLHARSAADAEAAAARIRAAMILGEGREAMPLVSDRVT